MAKQRAEAAEVVHNNGDVGQPYKHDREFNGPRKRRSCTDIICLILFLIFIGCWIGIAAYAYVNGNPEVLLMPKDSAGSRCGFDSHVKDKPYLFFFDLTKCLSPGVAFVGCNTPQVCLAKCPDKEFIRHPNYPSGGTGGPEDAICKDGYVPNDVTDLEEKIAQGDCARWYLKSQGVLNRCIYNVENLNTLRRMTSTRGIGRLLGFGVGDNGSGASNQIQEADVVDLRRKLKANRSVLSLTVDNTLSFFTYDPRVHQVGYDIVDDIENSWKEILFGLVIAIIFCLIYIGMMRWIAGVMVWLSILGTLALLVFCQYLTVNNYIYYKDHPEEEEQATSPLESYAKDDVFWMVLSIIVAVVLVIFLLVLLFLRARIQLAVALIKEGSKAVSSSLSTLIFPVFPWIMQIGVICLAISVALYLASTGDPEYKTKDFISTCTCTSQHTQNGEICNPDTFDKDCGNCLDGRKCNFVRMNYPPLTPYLHAFNVFGFFWGVFFVSALGEMILAATFATWYWTRNKSDVPFFNITNAIARTLRYHIGTLAFGSLIIAICRIIRVMLEYVDRKLKKYDNELTKAILCCCKCFFWCLESFLKFLNRNAYIMCAIHGKNFCASAKDAFGLLLRNVVRVFVLDKITDFLFFLSKVIVTFGVACICYAFLEFVSKKDLHYTFVPVIFIAICTYLIAVVFFSVYTAAVDTLFLCFLEDSERNDGSPDKPYFMSKNLLQILGKKNK